MNILNIEHVSKVFGEKVVLDDVSYGVHQGDKIGIIGINGTGKSTILKIIGGLEEPDEGQVITQNGLRITYLPQMPQFPEGASILDYVAEGKWQKDWSTESEARNVLNKLGIVNHEEKIDHLSGGQKKRVALARTLVNPCDVLLLDEPTNHLDNEMVTWLEDFLRAKDNPALLPIQIAYYTGLRIGEACSLTWQDIDLKEQRLTVRRSIRYNSARHRTEIGTTKRKKIRSVDFCNTLAEILKEAKKTQMLDRLACGPLYSQNYYLSIEEKNRTYYEVYSLPVSEHPPEGYQAISLVCVRQDGRYESPATVSNVCRAAKKRVDGMESFHFHQLRHTFTSNLLSYGAAPKDVQELLGHADVSTTMNIYAHATREAKRTSARLLDKVIGGE